MLDRKVAVVTGAGMGIGRATAIRLARENCDVVVLDRDPATLDEVCASIRLEGSKALGHAVDIMDDKAVVSSFEMIAAEFRRVDILVNNVGQSVRERAVEFAKSEPEMWDFTIDICLRSAMICARQVVNGMKDRRYGRIVNLTSVSAYKSNGTSSEYSAAKAGVIGFTRALASELAGFGITVNAIGPGLTKTRVMEKLPSSIVERLEQEIPMQRIAEPEDVANAIWFMASEKARYITGQTLLVNGGSWFV